MTNRPVKKGACEAQVEAHMDKSFHLLHGEGGGVCFGILFLDLLLIAQALYRRSEASGTASKRGWIGSVKSFY